ncbi:MAG TPA: prenyltransferase [Bacillota bacterium]|nr:prenyltransferase [Bacillota bacterium]
MRVGSFLRLVEIRTKVASMTPLILGSFLAYYRYGQFKPLNFIYMFLSLLAFDMATTAINNYIDYKRARKTRGYNYERHNAIVRDKIKESHVLVVIATLLTIAIVFGLILYMKTSLAVLIIGLISFIAGILYTFGPIPISRMPLGEIFSGFFMGFVIVFLSIFIHTTEVGILGLYLTEGILSLDLQLKEVMIIFLASLPATLGIANIMLANNICDMGDDLANKRYTLPTYIGVGQSLRIFRVLYYIAYLDIALLLVLGIFPVTTVPALLTIVPVQKNINDFLRLQTKRDTFSNAIKNFLIMNVSLIVLLGLAIIIGQLLG